MSNFISSARKLLERSYAGDYCGLIGLTLAYTWIQFSIRPFHRMFAQDDLAIQHPFAEHERVPVSMMFAYASGLPILVLIAFCIVTKSGWHKAHVTLLGLMISLILTSFITDVVKNTVGRPRPDLLARCIPETDAQQHSLLNIDSCTQSNLALLDEGFRSFPSGHSSFSFSGLGYLALFLAGQLRVFRPRADLFRVLIALTPVIGALLIAISRLEDYRHDFYDVTVGSLLGMTIAHVTYRRYYPPLRSAKCEFPYPPLGDDSHGELGRAHDEEEGIVRSDRSYERIPLQDRQ